MPEAAASAIKARLAPVPLSPCFYSFLSRKAKRRTISCELEDEMKTKRCSERDKERRTRRHQGRRRCRKRRRRRRRRWPPPPTPLFRRPPRNSRSLRLYPLHPSTPLDNKKKSSGKTSARPSPSSVRQQTGPPPSSALPARRRSPSASRLTTPREAGGTTASLARATSSLLWPCPSMLRGSPTSAGPRRCRGRGRTGSGTPRSPPASA